MKKTLILIRHAHRKTAGGTERELDNGLSEKGFEQAREVFKRFQKKIGMFEGDVAVFSSPKKRCVQTIQEIADISGVSLQVSPLLDEQQPSEGHAAFVKRIGEFISWWKKDAPSLTLLCSHGDWLPLCMDLLVSKESSFEKGGWVQVIQDSSGISIAKSSSD